MPSIMSNLTFDYNAMLLQHILKAQNIELFKCQCQ